MNISTDPSIKRMCVIEENKGSNSQTETYSVCIYQSPHELAFKILDRINLRDLLALRLVSKEYKSLANHYIAALTTTFSNPLTDPKQAINYLLRLYQATLKIWRKPDCDVYGPFLVKSYREPSERILRQGLFAVKAKLKDEKDLSWQPWLLKLCFSYPREVLALIPFFSACISQSKVNLIKDFSVNPEGLPLPKPLFQFIATHLAPHILVRSLDDDGDKSLALQLIEAEVDLTGEEFRKNFGKVIIRKSDRFGDLYPSPLHTAAAYDECELNLLKKLIKALKAQNQLDQCINQSFTDAPEGIIRHGYTPLMCAVEMMDCDKVKLLLEEGADPTICLSSGMSLLDVYFSTDCRDRDPKKIEKTLKLIFKALQSKNALSLLHRRNTNGHYPYSTWLVSIKEVDMLIKAGAALNITNVSYSPLLVARYILQTCDIPLNQYLPKGETALCNQFAELIEKDIIDKLQLFLDAGANPNLANRSDGQTPLLLAVKMNLSETIKLLLKRGADPNLANPLTGQTPVALAAEKDLKEIVALLLESGADNKEPQRQPHKT